MGAPSYCRKCDRPLAWANLEDIEKDHQTCPGCNTWNDLNRSLWDVLRDMERRLDTLEKSLLRDKKS